MSRARGYRTPFPQDYRVKRPGRGIHSRVGDACVPDNAAAVGLFEDWLLNSDDERARWMRDHLAELRGHDLACSCE
jgi:Domain of unknown function (DUF4326)